jgi:3-hydroxybutyryl-CoA dehydrogenase
MAIEKLGIVGCGIMGAGIAEAAALAGCTVTAVKLTAGDPNAVREKIAKSLDRAVQKNTITKEQRDAALARITVTRDLAALAGSDLVIESALEKVDAKRDLLAQIESHLGPDAVLASNTSSLRLATIAQGLTRPCRFLGVHFFNPATLMKLVEVSATDITRTESVDDVIEWCARIGKTPVRVGDQPGYIVNRLLVPMLTHAMALYEAGVASIEDMDTAMKLGCGHPMGPFTLADFIGLDVVLAMARTMAAEHGDARFTPPSILVRLVAAGHLGKKSKLGFYDYSGATPTMNPMLVARAASKQVSLTGHADERPSVV